MALTETVKMFGMEWDGIVIGGGLENLVCEGGVRRWSGRCEEKDP